MNHQSGPERRADRTRDLLDEPSLHLTRRFFLAQLGAVGIGATTAPLLRGAAPAPIAPPDEVQVGGTDAPAGTVAVVLEVNGGEHRLQLDPRATLLDTLREKLSLFGTKKGCDHGQCGACTVHMNGRRVNSCLTFAIMHERDEITTIEGLAEGGELHPVQAAFLEHDGFQCGYCTPGQIMSAAALLKEGHPTDDASVREFMSGNICRCGAYDNILAAIKAARGGS